MISKLPVCCQIQGCNLNDKNIENIMQKEKNPRLFLIFERNQYLKKKWKSNYSLCKSLYLENNILYSDHK